MALESTNNWVVKNYRATPWYSQPFAVLVAQTSYTLDGYMIVFDLYKGTSYRTTVNYIEQVDVYEAEDQSEHERLMVENSNYAKAAWLEEKAEELDV